MQKTVKSTYFFCNKSKKKVLCFSLPVLSFTLNVSVKFLWKQKWIEWMRLNAWYECVFFYDDNSLIVLFKFFFKKINFTFSQLRRLNHVETNTHTHMHALTHAHTKVTKVAMIATVNFRYISKNVLNCLRIAEFGPFSN